MGTYQLYCFGKSGNAYKAALMLELCHPESGSLSGSISSTAKPAAPAYRKEVNEIGKVPVLLHGAGTSLTQSGVILDYLAGTNAAVRRQERQ